MPTIEPFHRSNQIGFRNYSKQINNRILFLITAVFLAAIPFLLWETAVSPTQAAAGEITGTLYRDFNSDGVRDATEPGVINITVSAYDDAGFVISTTTNISGEYTLSGLTDATAYRLEITNLPNYLHPGVFGNNSDTTTIRATSPADNVDVALQNPAEFCEANPELFTTCFVSGDPLPVTSTVATEPVVVSFPYSSTGNAGSSGPTPTYLAEADEIGAVWGLSYHQPSERIFVASVLKRHAGLGPNGGAAIYAIDKTGATAPTLFVDLFADFGIDVGIPTTYTNSFRGIDPDHTVSSRDQAAFNLAGTVGFGDIDISDDKSTLWVVNLFDKKLYGLTIDAIDNPGSYPGYTPTETLVPDPGCNDGQSRPWATEFYQDKVYVGVVCDGEDSTTRDDLSAHVYAYDTINDSWSTSLIDIPLNYDKGCVRRSFKCQWNPWTDVSEYATSWSNIDDWPINPQPILSDIEFDAEGSMMLAFLDRAGLQIGWFNWRPDTGTNNIAGMAGGDLLRTYFDGTNFILENNGVAGPYTSSGTGGSDPDKREEGGVDSLQGPGGGEFFWAEYYRSTHAETSIGSIALRMGSQELLATIMDPTNNFDSGGIHWYDTTNGDLNQGYQLYFTGNGTALPTYGKASGLGDLELLCSAAPLEIGNFVWIDTDGDGLQDPSELGLDGVTLTLHDMDNGGAIVGTAVTTNGGFYYFGGTADTNMSTGSLLTNRRYEIRIDTTQAAITTPGYHLTTPNAAQPANGNSSDTSNRSTTDLADSDGNMIDDNAVIALTTGIAGANNHALDYGFTTVPLAVGLADFGVQQPFTANLFLFGLILVMCLTTLIIKAKRRETGI